MRNLFPAATIFALTAFAFAGPAAAEAEYRYCATASWGAGGCYYATLEQCHASTSGNAGYCVENPRYTPATNAGAQPRPRRR